jgi:hypothetical protein
MIQDLMNRVHEIEAPEDSSPSGMFWVFVERFCTRNPARAKDEILNGRPWTENEHTWFTTQWLLDFLFKYHVKGATEINVAAWLTECKTTKKERWEVRGKRVEVWGVPAYKDLEPRQDAPAGPVF